MSDSKSMVVSGSGVAINTLERMSQAIAKSGLFAVKTPEAAFTLLLIADAEGIPPAQAMMDYDIIEGKPALKSAAMLARFLRSGGKVQWLTNTDDCVSGKFTSQNGSEITVTWDVARVTKAGLAGKNVHSKFPLQMKRARCISEAIRAISPQCIPVGMYTQEETEDMDKDVQVVSVQEAVQSVKVMDKVTEDAFVDNMNNAKTEEELKYSFQAAWRESKEYPESRRRFQSVYDQVKKEMADKAFDQPNFGHPTEIPDRI